MLEAPSLYHGRAGITYSMSIRHCEITARALGSQLLRMGYIPGISQECSYPEYVLIQNPVFLVLA